MKNKMKHNLLITSATIIREGMQGKRHLVAVEMPDRSIKTLSLNPINFTKLVYKELVRQYKKYEPK